MVNWDNKVYDSFSFSLSFSFLEIRNSSLRYTVFIILISLSLVGEKEGRSVSVVV